MFSVFFRYQWYWIACPDSGKNRLQVGQTEPKGRKISRRAKVFFVLFSLFRGIFFCRFRQESEFVHVSARAMCGVNPKRKRTRWKRKIVLCKLDGCVFATAGNRSGRRCRALRRSRFPCSYRSKIRSATALKRLFVKCLLKMAGAVCKWKFVAIFVPTSDAMLPFWTRLC